MANVYKGRGYVYFIQYHFVWCVKYQRDILIDEVEDSLKQILQDIVNKHEFTILEMETDKDHVHLLVG